MWFWAVNDMIELVLYLSVLNFTYPSHVFAYPRLNTTVIDILRLRCGVCWADRLTLDDPWPV
jgi:hypothetical protein